MGIDLSRKYPKMGVYMPPFIRPLPAQGDFHPINPIYIISRSGLILAGRSERRSNLEMDVISLWLITIRLNCELLRTLREIAG